MLPASQRDSGCHSWLGSCVGRSSRPEETMWHCVEVESSSQTIVTVKIMITRQLFQEKKSCCSIVFFSPINGLQNY